MGRGSFGSVTAAASASGSTGSRPGWVDDRLYPFEDRWAEVDGCTIHYVDEGDGPLVVMLHGNPTWSFLYRRLIVGLRDDYRCIAVDHPGFGLSSARAAYGFTPAEHSRVFEHFVETLDLREMTLVGQDWGGPIGLGAAVRAPERYRAFVLGNTGAWPFADELKGQVFSRFLGGPIGGWLIRNRNFFVERMIPFGTTTDLSDEVMDHYRGPFPDPDSRTPARVFPDEIRKSREFLADLEGRLTAITDRPALLISGDKDPAFGAPSRKRFEQVFPNHRSLAYPEAGHYWQEDVPEEVVAEFREWWPEAVGSATT